jgi:hypothetical protein
MGAHSARLAEASALLDRRHFIAGILAASTAGSLAKAAHANVPVAYDWNAAPPTDPKSDFINWMTKNRGEEPAFLGQLWDGFIRFLARRVSCV